MELKDAIQKVDVALNLPRQMVGVTLLKDEEAFEKALAQESKARLAYCVMVKLATHGYANKAKANRFACLSAARALGIAEADPDWLSGQIYADKGMYKDIKTAQKVVRNTTNICSRNIGVMTQPLTAYAEQGATPDIVIIVADAYNIMRLLQGYTHQFGTYGHYKLIGNQALCSECTAYPYETDDINLSAMCAGTRHMAGWSKEEMALGIPYEKFLGMADGLYRTVNIMETDQDKERIDQRINEQGVTDLRVEFGKNYFTGLYLK